MVYYIVNRSILVYSAVDYILLLITFSLFFMLAFISSIHCFFMSSNSFLLIVWSEFIRLMLCSIFIFVYSLAYSFLFYGIFFVHSFLYFSCPPALSCSSSGRNKFYKINILLCNKFCVVFCHAIFSSLHLSTDVQEYNQSKLVIIIIMITSFPAMSLSSSSLTSPLPIRAFRRSFSAFNSLDCRMMLMINNLFLKK